MSRRQHLLLWTLSALLGWWFGSAHAALPMATHQRPAKPSPAEAAVLRYVSAMAQGDSAQVGRMDFACAYRLVRASSGSRPSFPPETNPFYATCWESIRKAHAAVIQATDSGIDTLWPGKGWLVVFEEDLARYPPSCFVMETLGAAPPAGGFRVELLGSQPLPPASIRLTEDGPVHVASATRVRVRVSYKDPLLSPVSVAPRSARWTTATTRPRLALKSLTLRWIVLSGLKQLGFPSDMAVLNLPIRASSAEGPAVPATAEPSGYEPGSAQWWQPADAPGLLLAAVARAQMFPELHDRLAMLNRVLLIDPAQLEALTMLTQELYHMLMQLAARTLGVVVSEPALARVFNELYWTTSAQTTRWDPALGMQMDGVFLETAADCLHRAIPAMEQLAKVRPQDFENRLHLGNVYRWNGEYQAAIAAHLALLSEVPSHRTTLRARILNELAWSRITKVAWNHTFSALDLEQAYREAQEAFQLTDIPLERFLARYTMAWSVLLMADRDHHQLLDLLTEARALFLTLPGASPALWRYLLGWETLKMVLDADPIFQPLFEGANG